MSDEFLINVTPQETRVALMQQGVVQELHIERTASRGMVGNVYLGTHRARAARHAVGVHRHRPGTYCLPACRRPVGGAPQRRAGAAHRTPAVRGPEPDGAGAEGSRSAPRARACPPRSASPAGCWSICRRKSTSASRSASRTNSIAKRCAPSCRRWCRRTSRAASSCAPWPRRPSDEELAADIAYLRKHLGGSAQGRQDARSRRPCCTRT